MNILPSTFTSYLALVLYSQVVAFRTYTVQSHRYRSKEINVVRNTMLKRSRTISLFIIVAFLQLLSLELVNATQVKWTGSTSGNDDPAATAPRSQKYWDENGIKRPDYAKTDAELAADRAERGESSGGLSGLSLALLAGLAAVAYVGRGFYQDSGGARLEGSSSFFKRQLTDVEQREARLARFDADMKAD